MLKSILFTKNIDKTLLNSQLGNDIVIDSISSLERKLNSQSEILNQINPNYKQYLITSQNSVDAIKNIQINGNFYVVGKKTALRLKNNGFNVVLEKDYADELAQEILTLDVEKGWNFFCGNTRRDTLVNILTENGHNLNEIITYQSTPIENKINKDYDAYVFFSPLSFYVFTKNNIIPEKSVIFTIGKTTTTAVEKIYKNNAIITANFPVIEMVLKQIKDSINDKK